MNQIEQFNVRVYGLLVNEKNEILLTDEFRIGINMTKFPGGGLMYGESTVDCLKRECIEELGQEIEIIDHFYTTDFFQKTLITNNNRQLISIYYFIKTKEKIKFQTVDMPFSFTQNIDGPQCFRFRKISELTENELTFPIDKKVVRLLKQKFCL